MALSNFFFILLIFIISISIPKIVLAQTQFRHKDCGGTTYTPNSPFKTNLDSVLHSLSIDTRITYGFYNFTAGHGPDQASSLGLCRGDVPLNTCRLCIRNSTALLTTSDVCPNQKVAFGYSGYCSVFVSNGSIYGKIQEDIGPWLLSNPETSVTIPSPKSFNESLNSLMVSLQNRAAAGNSTVKYASGKANNVSGGLTLYGLVQCTPDLSKQTCIECIQDSLQNFPECCNAGVMVVHPSCFVRYETNPFFDNVPNLSLPPQNITTTSIATSGRRGNKKSRIILDMSIALGLSTLLVLSIAFSIRARRNRLIRRSWMVKFTKEEVKALRSLQFSLRTIKNATQNFSDDFKLGEGGFGSVYKGVLPDGQEIAVKRLVRNSGQGDAEFKNEILILAKLKHRNLVTLHGFCLHGKEMILIYEFVANRSLDYFIFDPLSRQSMQWETRYKIINGIARGILYLHEGSQLKIIHRDLKAANVLLDEDFYPKIADFGMARLFNMDQTRTLASKIVGTLGYISPEYALQSQVSVKSDVYSFGVLVLEIVSGQRITSFIYDEQNQENLLTFAWRNWNKGTPWNLVDPVIPAGCSAEILRCIHIGLLCVQDNPEDRPTMSSVDLMLSSDSVTLQAPLQPAFCSESQILPDMLLNWSTTTKSSTNTKSIQGSVNDVSVTELHPR